MSDGSHHNWASGTLGDAVEIVRGISFPSGDKKFEPGEGLIACLRTTNVQRDVEWTDLWYVPERHMRRQEQEVRVGDILISTANSLELVGKVAPVRHVPHRATLGAFISLLRPSGLLRPEFVYYQVTAGEYQAAIRGTASTTTNISNVSTEKLRFLPFRFAPVAEQSRIVAEIEKQFTRLDAAVAALKRVQANLKRYRAAVLKAACEGRLVPTEAEVARKEGRSRETGEQLLARILKERRCKWEAEQLAKMTAVGKTPTNDDWRRKYKEPLPPVSRRLPMLPEGWIWASVEQLTPGNRSCAYGVLQPGPHLQGGVPFVRVGDLDDGYVDAASLKRISPSIAAMYPRTSLSGGEVLLAIVGATIGKTAVAPLSLSGANTARAVAVIPLPEKTIHSRWVELWFRNPTKVAEMKSLAHEVARQTLNLEDVRAAAVALPPYQEQARIVDEVEDRLTLTKAAFTSASTQLAKSVRLRQSILKRAFEGTLVAQDPNDEPATVLLERIRAERPAKAQPPKWTPRT